MKDCCLVELLERRVNDAPHHLVITFPEKITYQDLSIRISGMEKVLRQLDVSGKRIACVSDRVADLFVAMFAVLKCGGTFFPVSPELNSHSFTRIISGLNPFMLIGDDIPITVANLSTCIISSDGELLRKNDEVEHFSLYSENKPGVLLYSCDSNSNEVSAYYLDQTKLLEYIQSLWSNITPPDGGTMLYHSYYNSSDFIEFIIMALLSTGTIYSSRERNIDKFTKELISFNPSYVKVTNRIWKRMLRQLINENTTSFPIDKLHVSGSSPISSIDWRIWNKLCKSGQEVIYYFMPDGFPLSVAGSRFSSEDTRPENMSTLPLNFPVKGNRIRLAGNVWEEVPTGVPANFYVENKCMHDAVTENRSVSRLTADESGRMLLFTGTVGRFLPEGEIELLGHKEIGTTAKSCCWFETEAAFATYPGVKEVVLENNGQDINVYIQSASVSITATELIRHLRSCIAEDRILTRFFLVEEIPLLISGEADLALLPGLAKHLLKPDGGMKAAGQDKLLEIWKELLKVNYIEEEDDFFLLGGNSLKAALLASRIRQQLEVEVNLRDIFENCTLGKLAGFLALKKKSTCSPIPAIPESSYYRVSATQKRLWLIDQMHASGSLAYNLCGAYTFKGNLSINAFSKAFALIIDRHESLRTLFVMADGELRQRVCKAEELYFTPKYLDYSQSTDKHSLVQELMRKELKGKFDLAKGPLLRAIFVKMDENHYTFLFSMHHIISDGWSVEILKRELAYFYNREVAGLESGLPPLKVQFKEYSEWYHQELVMKGEEHLDRLKEKFVGPLTATNLPEDMKRPLSKTYKGKLLVSLLTEEVTLAFRDLCRNHSLSLYTGLMTVVKVLLHKLTHQQDIIIGTPAAGRNHSEVEGLIGLFTNTVPLRTKIVPSLSFIETASVVRESVLSSLEHELLPFDYIIDKLNIQWEQGHSPMFDILVSLDNTGSGDDFRLDNINVDPVFVDMGTSQFDLAIEFLEKGNTLSVKFEYDTDLYHLQTIERLSELLIKAIEYFIQKPKSSIEEFSVYTEEEIRMLHCWSTALNKPAGSVRLRDMFVEMGGTEEIAKVLVSLINQYYPGKISYTDIFIYPTVALLINYLHGGGQIESIVLPTVSQRNSRKL